MVETGQRVGEYVLEEPLGKGAFGQVWRARHHVWAEQRVAVKIPTDPQYLRNLQHEGVAVQGLLHPNIVRALGFDPYADPPYLITEYIPGQSLRAMMAKQKMTVDEAVVVMRQVLSGLGHAHRAGIVHRDVKPENILVHERAAAEGIAGEGMVKITDFGLGKAASDIAVTSIAYSASLNSPDAREIAGTLDYMAPEQRAAGPVDRRADLYACGVVLYEMLTGERPAGTDLPSDMNAAVPRHLDEAFKRSYARLEKRFASAEEFLAALGSPAPDSPPPLPKVAGSVATCPQCRAAVGAEDQFCMHCGVQLVKDVRRCVRCGGYPERTDQYCIFCGETLSPRHLAAV